MYTEVEIPEGVEVVKEAHDLVVRGKLGELRRTFLHPHIKVEVKDDKVVFSSDRDTRKEKRMMNTFAAHLRNMIKGVTKGYVYKLKIVFTHFPISVKKQGNLLLIENLFGEKKPRKAKILEGVEVEVEGDEIVVKGIDKEKVGQTAANIEQATRRPGYDKRVFQDGIYIFQKDEKVLV